MIVKRYFKPAFLFLLILSGISALLAQEKKPLDHDVYDIWNIIKEKSISTDGSWLAYSTGSEDGDNTLQITHLNNGPAFTIERAESAEFSFDARFAAYIIKPAKAAVLQAKRAKKKKDELPKDSLEIRELSTGEVLRYDNVRSYKMPEKNGDWIAAYLDPQPSPSDSGETGGDKAADSKKKEADSGELVLKKLGGESELRFQDVADFLFSKNGDWLVYTVAAENDSLNGVFAVFTPTLEEIALMSGPGDYKQAAFDDDGKQLAFLANRDDFTADQPSYQLYHWPIESRSPEAVAAEGGDGIPAGWWISEHGKVSFSKDGNRLFFGTAPRPDSAPDDSLLAEEKMNVDIWHWQDPYLQTMQLYDLKTEQKRNYLAAVELRNNKVIQLANQEIPDVTVGLEGTAEIALGISNMPYRQEISWDYPEYYDVYVVNAESGASTRVIEKLQFKPQLSSFSKYIAWWNRGDSCWYAYDIETRQTRNLTATIPVTFYNHRQDYAYNPGSYGNAGWTNNDEFFLLYDKYDTWQIDPAGNIPPRNITNQYGRTHNIRFRRVRLDPEETFVDTDRPQLLKAFHYADKREGFFQADLVSGRSPEELILMPKRFSDPEKAENSDVLLYTREDVAEFPDLWVSDLDFGNARKISNVNPQQDQYRWANVEPVEWTSLDGEILHGLLYKPEDFDPARKYPLIVYFYSKHSDYLYRHLAPYPHRSIINPVFYASRNYIVFVPDIRYKIGYPGESALNSVVPGVTKLIADGFIDADNIGVQGHSWGGYQISYMITRTNLFKAAEAGAPVSNMISAYGGIRWESGWSRMFQYERDQSRIGGSLWEYPMRFIENSPIFFADKIQTPLLIMHNDHDGAVPWYQGIELFVALRRLGKPAWLINYNDEPHWPMKYHKKVDWQMRLQQYFDHYLKGAPAPVWLKDGIPAVKKGQTLGLEPAGNE